MAYRILFHHSIWMYTRLGTYLKEIGGESALGEYHVSDGAETLVEELRGCEQHDR